MALVAALTGLVVAGGAAVADPATTYTVTNLGTVPYYGGYQSPLGSLYGPSAVTTGGVLFYLDGLLVNGTFERPDNDPAPVDFNNDYSNLNGHVAFLTADNAGVIGGALLGPPNGSHYDAVLWPSATSKDYSTVDFSSLDKQLGQTVTSSVVSDVSDVGPIFGQATTASKAVSFEMSSPTAAPQLAVDPVSGEPIAISDVAYPWATGLEEDGNGGHQTFLVNFVAKTHTQVLSDAYPLVSTNGTIVSPTGQVTRTDGTTYQLAAPDGDTIYPIGISNGDVVAGSAYDPNTEVQSATTWSRSNVSSDLSTIAGEQVAASVTGPSGRVVAVSYSGGNNRTAYLFTPQGNPPPVVNSTGDAPAVTAGSQGCTTGKTVTVNGASAPECTLRAAIQAENAGSVTAKTISFALPSGAGAIAPGTPLPALKAVGVTVDGTTGPGGLVVVNGTALDQGQAVLHVSGGSDTVAGVVPELATIGVLVDAKAGHDTVRGCSIGVASPTSPSSTQISVGVKVLNSPSVTIGGVSAVDGNVISGVGVGVFVDGTASHGAVVQGNYVGSDAAGDSEPDSAGVVLLDASGARIGGRPRRRGRRRATCSTATPRAR